jgi:hypothetical protein
VVYRLPVSAKKAPTLLADGTDVGNVSAHALSVLAVDTAMYAKAIAEKAAAEASEAKQLAKGNSKAIGDLSELIGKIGASLGDLASTNQTLVELINAIRKDMANGRDSKASD